MAMARDAPVRALASQVQGRPPPTSGPLAEEVGVNDDQPHVDRPNMEAWQAPILRTIPLPETMHGNESRTDGFAPSAYSP